MARLSGTCGIARTVLNHGNSCALLVELKRIATRKYEQALSLAQTLRRLRDPRSRMLQNRAARTEPHSRKSAKRAWGKVDRRIAV